MQVQYQVTCPAYLELSQLSEGGEKVQQAVAEAARHLSKVQAAKAG